MVKSALQGIDWLAEIRDSRGISDEAERVTRRAVVNARKCGYPWRAIAEALGVTRQAATERYEKHCV